VYRFLKCQRVEQLYVANATVPSKSNESSAIWVNAMVFLRLIVIGMLQIYCLFSDKTYLLTHIKMC
jgi:hypothetical protein